MDTNFIMFTNIFVWLITGITFISLPFVNKRYVEFGVSVPKEHIKRLEFKKIRVRYAVLVALVTIISLAVVMIFSLKDGVDDSRFATVYMISIFTLILLNFLIYLNCHLSVKKLKKKENWQFNGEDIIVVDTNFRKGKLTINSLWFLIYIIIITITIVVPLSMYNTLPDILPTHFDASGIANGWTEKDVAVFMMPITQIIMLLLFFFINFIIGKSKQEIDANDPEASAAKNSTFRYSMSIFLFISGLLLEIIFFVAQLSTIMIITSSLFIVYLPLIVSALIVIGAIVLMFVLGQGGWRLKNKEKSEKGIEEFDRNDDKYWKLGMFYFNPKDPSLFVEKRFGLGWTNNFARPISWIFLLIILGIVALSIILV